MKTPLLPLVLRRLAPLFLFLAALSATRSFATNPNPPQFMAYQGYLTDGNGNALGSTNTGPKNYDVVFRIWDVQTGGITNVDELYAEQQTVTVNNGYFSVLLGEGSAYSIEPHTNALSGLFVGANAAARFVEITVLGIGASGANITILPRLQLLTSPYAFLAANAVNAASAGSLVNNNNATQVVTVTNGAVGINTTSPSGVLEVDGIFNSPPLLTLKNYDATWSTAAYFDAFRYITTAYAGPQTDGNVKQFNVGAGGVSIGYTNVPIYGSSDALYVSGNVGIGTAAPTSSLSVAGTANFTGNVGIGTTSPSASLSVAGSANLTGTLGVGVTSPATTLEVAGTATIDADLMAAGAVHLGGSFTNHSQGAALEWNKGNGDGGTYLVNQKGGGGGGFHFDESDTANNLTERLTINSSGNVGIATTSPAYPLDVNGSGRFSGSVQIGSGITSGFYGDGGNLALRTYPNGAIYFQTASGASTPMYIAANGYVGIGTTSPLYPLEVQGAQVSGNNSGYLMDHNGPGSQGNKTYSAGIYCASDVMSSGFWAISDARTKQIVSRTDTRDDLAKVRELQITDYRKVDKVQFGGRLEKGVIAQEVEAVVPEAVTISTNFIPDIYARPLTVGYTNQTLTVTLAQAPGLVVGDQVRLITEAGILQAPVSAILSPVTFALGQVSHLPRQIFVYGKQVGDFRTVNYDRLFSTGLGAIQELAKRMDDVEAREAHMAELEKKVAQVTSLEQEVADLKKMVTQLAGAQMRSKQTAQAEAATPATDTVQKTLITASLER